MKWNNNFPAKQKSHQNVKLRVFFSESTDVFVITSNRRTFFSPETENLNFDDGKFEF